MDSSVLDLKKQLPDILKALNRKEKIIVSYGNKKLALLQPLPEGKTNIRDDPAFGMWRDREDLADPSEFVRTLRRGRNLMQKEKSGPRSGVCHAAEKSDDARITRMLHRLTLQRG